MLDCGPPIPKERLKALLLASADDGIDLNVLQEKVSRLRHFSVPDLAHLLAFFVHPTDDFIDSDVALVVVESVSTVFDTAYSKVQDAIPKKQSDSAKWNISRRYAMMGELVSRLQRLATLNGLAVIVTQQTRMRIRSGAGALLLPILTGHEWESVISTQLILFRDFPPKTMTQSNPELSERWSRLRYVGVIKLNGISAEENGRYDTVVPFSIEKVWPHGHVEETCTKR